MKRRYRRRHTCRRQTGSQHRSGQQYHHCYMLTIVQPRFQKDTYHQPEAAQQDPVAHLKKVPAPQVASGVAVKLVGAETKLAASKVMEPDLPVSLPSGFSRSSVGQPMGLVHL